MEATVTVFISSELQAMLLERCSEPVLLIGRALHRDRIEVFTAVETQRLGSVVWAPIGLDAVVGSLQPELPKNGDNSGKLQLFVKQSKLCGLCNGSNVRIEELSSLPNVPPLTAASAELQLSVTSLQGQTKVDVDQENLLLQCTVQLDQSQHVQALSPHQSIEIAVPCTRASSAHESAAAPDSTHESEKIKLSLQALLRVSGSATPLTSTQEVCCTDPGSTDAASIEGDERIREETVASAVRSRLHAVAQQLEMMLGTSRCNEGGACIAHFQLPGHAVPLAVLYPAPRNTASADECTERLLEWRQMLHKATLCSTRTPLFRLHQQLKFEAPAAGGGAPGARLRDLHLLAQASPLASKSKTFQVRTAKVAGSYEYYHYKQDGCDDVGWGCAYRSLQTVWSWFHQQAFTDRPPPCHSVRPAELRYANWAAHVNQDGCARLWGATAPPLLRGLLPPELVVKGVFWGAANASDHIALVICTVLFLENMEIQESLVSLGDKEPSFVGSKQWVGAIEAGMVLQHELAVEYRVISVASGAAMPSKVRDIAAHFQSEGTPIMIGGGVLAYTLLGVEWVPDTGAAAFLILDPHYTGVDEIGPVVGKWVAWKQLGHKAAAGGPLFRKDAFYNLLCPFRPRVV